MLLPAIAVVSAVVNHYYTPMQLSSSTIAAAGDVGVVHRETKLLQETKRSCLANFKDYKGHGTSFSPVWNPVNFGERPRFKSPVGKSLVPKTPNPSE